MRRFLRYLFVGILLAACQAGNLQIALAPQSAAVATPTNTNDPLGVGNWRYISELATFSGESSTPVAALAFTENNRDLLVVHGGHDGVLQRWQVESGRLSNTIDIGPVGMAAVGFDAKANLLAIGAGATAPAVAGGYSADFEGVHLWDTRSGQKVLETASADMYYGLPATDVALNSSGQMLAIVDSGGLSVWDTNTKKPIFLLVIGSEIKKNYNTSSTTSVAIDRTGTWIAHANDNGTVEIEDREQNHIVWSVQIQDEGTPLALAFDTSRSRLAAVTSKSLTMWDLRGSTQNEALNAPLLDSPLASLAFSPDGSLLAVGTSNGWQVWSVADRKLLSENKRPTYAIAFSPDGRLFASGDALGVIHVWGLRNP